MGQVLPFSAGAEPIRIAVRPQRNPPIESAEPHIEKWPALDRFLFTAAAAVAVWSLFLSILYPALRLLDVAYGAFHHG